ncbi:MAG TPA: exopolysaccharide biosynthesis polyprenyl glycosylphosphotransferase [Candidatus Acidoferrum sp.]|nr:exopolysaccharide biosynthesis polyprenyl glycosylphosphotransferase [Candidatus Acidoferrum sp.]
MIRGRLKRAQFGLNLLILCMPLVAFSLAAYLRFATRLLPRYSIDAEPPAYFGLLLLTTILWAIVAEHFEIASIEKHLVLNGTIRRTLKACLVTFVAVLAMTFFYRETTFSRIFIWLSGANLFFLVLVLRLIFRWAWLSGRIHHNPSARVLMIGADDFAVRVATSLLSDRITPCTIKAHVRLPEQNSTVKNSPVYALSELEKLAIGNGIDDVVIAIPPSRLGELASLRKQLSALCAPSRLVLDVGGPLDTQQRLFSVGDLTMLDLQGTPAESVLYIILKRAFDIAFSLSVLILAAPVFGLIALTVRLSSPGPVFFIQERVGLNGQLFRMFKFRTMAISTKADSDTRWTVKDDPRRTRIGSVLRKTGLDELPQFFNVLRGDMSVVGPRPERPILVQRFMQSVGNYNRRHYLKVGITGWAQVNGWRGDTSIEKRIEYDLYYVRHWTITFDLLIVVLTLVRGFSDKNAY